MGDTGGRLAPIVVGATEYLPPSIEGLALQARGRVRESRSVGTGQAVLEHPGFARYYCEKSEAVYYWDESRKRFGEIWTGD
jgi:hypothetical protein